MVGKVGMEKHNAIGDGGEFRGASQGVEGIIWGGATNMVDEEDGEMEGAGDAFERGKDGKVVG